jgi:AraC-like DNA-binding protein
MAKTITVQQSGIFFTCKESDQVSFKNITPEHSIIYVYSGRMTLGIANCTYSLTSGQTALISRNQMVSLTKNSLGGHPFKAIAIFLTQDFLRAYYKSYQRVNHTSSQVPVLKNARNLLLDGLFSSVSSYADLNESAVPRALASIKMNEAVTIFRSIQPLTDLILSDFSEPDKLDLSDYMQKNFLSNVSIERFAYLTGRSLATFKRDFKKVFGSSPQKWLTEKRLAHAHFLIAENGMKPSKAFLQSGFENFSHFTFIFKKFFGYNPSKAVSRQTN